MFYAFRLSMQCIFFFTFLTFTHCHPIQGPLKAIIFDLDGTIVDSEQFWFSVFKKIIEKRGFTFDAHDDEALFKVMHGNSGSNIFRWIKEKYAIPESVEALCQEFRELSKTLDHKNIALVPGFDAFFKEVQSYSLQVAIASNIGTHSLSIIDNTIDLKSRFGIHLYHYDHVKQSKPSPAVYLFAMKQLNIEPHECIAIEDSASGIAAAQAAGIFCIGLDRGNHNSVAKADMIVAGYEEIKLNAFFS